MEEELKNKNRKEEELGGGIEREGKKEQEKDSGVLHRFSATREADEALNRIVERVNDGFNGGRVSRTQVLSWLLLHEAEGLSESMIQEIRVEFFDEVALLESILRQAKATGKVPQEFRGLLQKQLGLDEQPKRKGKRPIDE